MRASPTATSPIAPDPSAGSVDGIVDERRIEGAGGIGLHVRVWEVADGGAPFLLVHGLASNARLWDGVAEVLAARGHRVAALDLRGHGHSDKPDDGYDYDTVCDDVVAVADALAMDRPVAVGQSWGGNVVLELAARLGGDVRGVACIDGGTLDLQARFATWEECADALSPPRLNGTPFSEIERTLRRLHADWPETGIRGALACFEVRDDGTVAPWLTRERHLAILREMWERRPGDAYPAVKAPVLLAPAADDDGDWTARKEAEVAAAEATLATVRTHWFRPAHHDVHAQHPGAVAALLDGCVADGFFS
jgi:pimeloyl-ACP methyl ester carboxylesterase